MKLERSIYKILQTLSISLTDKTPLRDLFDKQNFNNVKELNGSSEPNLFEFINRSLFFVDSNDAKYIGHRVVTDTAAPSLAGNAEDTIAVVIISGLPFCYACRRCSDKGLPNHIC